MKKITQIQRIRNAVEKISDSKITKLKADCIDIINLHESMKNSYFFHSMNNATSRRHYEAMNSQTTEFIFDDTKYVVKQITKCSCNNVYFNTDIYPDKDTEYKLDIGFIKKILKAIEEKENK